MVKTQEETSFNYHKKKVGVGELVSARGRGQDCWLGYEK